MNKGKFKSIIITGAGKGLGAEIAKQVSKKYYVYYDISRFNSLDVKNIKQLKKFIENIKETNEVYLPSCLINNAGVCIPASVLNFNYKNYKKQFDTNVLGILNCTQLYTQLCIKNSMPGKIINIASTAGTGARPGNSIYAATKASVISLSKSMSEELKSYNIKVYCISPAAFDSQLRRNLYPDDNFSNMIKKENIANFIMKIVEDENGIEFLANQNLIIRR